MAVKMKARWDRVRSHETQVEGRLPNIKDLLMLHKYLNCSQTSAALGKSTMVCLGLKVNQE